MKELRNIFKIMICLSFLGIIAFSLFIQSPLINYDSNTQSSPLSPQLTGDLKIIDVNFEAWTEITGPNRLYQATGNLSLNILEGTQVETADGLGPQYITSSSGTYVNTQVSDGVVYHFENKINYVYAYASLYFTNPSPSRQYYRAGNEWKVKWHDGTSDKDRLHLYTTNQTGGYVLTRSFTNEDTWYWESIIYASPQSIQIPIMNLGGTWPSTFYQKMQRYNGPIFDDIFVDWDYAAVLLYYYYYYSLGDIQSPIYTLADGTHPYKRLNNITYAAEIPTNTAIQFQYKVNSPTGWTGWQNCGNGEYLNMVAAQVQLRATLTTSAEQKTARITNVTINYGDPPALTPVIASIQQIPPGAVVNFLTPVTIVAGVETFVAPNMVLLNYTTNNWGTFTLVPMTGTYVKIKNSYTGVISGQASLITVKYKVFVNMTYAATTYKQTSSEYSYAIAAPPYFTHNQNTDLKPARYPSASTMALNISCLVFDTTFLISQVKLQADFDGTIINYTMVNEPTTAKYFYNLNISPLHQDKLFYRFWAINSMSAFNTTQWYSTYRNISRFIQCDVLNGTRREQFNESMLAACDASYHILNSTNIGGGIQLTDAIYTFNFSTYARPQIEQIAVDYCANTFSKSYLFRTMYHYFMQRPVSIVINKTGFIYIADQASATVRVFTPNGENLYEWGSQGSGDGQFLSLRAIAVNSTGYVYTVEDLGARVQVFTAYGGFVTKFSSSFATPKGIAVNSSGFVYVSDTGNNRIKIFRADGTYITFFGSTGGSNGQFNSPQDITINETNFVYVVDYTNVRIQVFRPDGTYITKFGSAGIGDGQFINPRGFGINSLGLVYIADKGNERIQIFSADGTYLTQFSVPLYYDCTDVAINGSGFVFIADYDNYAMHVYSQIEVGVNVALYNYQSSSWNSIYSTLAVGGHWFSRLLRTNPKDYVNLSGFLQIRVQAYNVSGYPFTYYLNKLDVALQSAPPYFQHNQLTDVKPTYQPSMMINWLNITVYAYNGYPGVGIVILQEDLTGSIVNHTMQNETLSKYFYYFADISALGPEDTLSYRFWANDTEGLINWTQWYYITRDLVGPTIVSWTVPYPVEYDDPVYIWANITDPNSVAKVVLNWTATTWPTSGFNQSRTMVKQYGNTWATTSAIGAQTYWVIPDVTRRVVKWVINATDTVGNSRIIYFSYLIEDFTSPSVINIAFSSSVQSLQEVVVNITMTEPAGASGIDDTSCSLYYGLASEDYLPHTRTIFHVSGNLWQATIPGQILYEEVIFQIFVQDKAGNNYTSETFNYVVTEVVALVTPQWFWLWVFIIAISTTAFIVVRYLYKERFKGKLFLAVGLGVIIGLTIVMWLLLPVFTFKGLTFQQYMLQLGSTWPDVLYLVTIVMVLGLSPAVLWYVNRRFLLVREHRYYITID